MKVFGLFAAALANTERLEKLKGHGDNLIALANNNTDLNDFTKNRISNLALKLLDQAEGASMNCNATVEDSRLFDEENRGFSADDLCQLTNDLAGALRSYARRFTCEESLPKKLFVDKYINRTKKFTKIVERKAFCGLGM
ncbi:Oidioi.mRNA.OKI2018_I69.chr2.g5593.t1.cds [Oikopleura dioica]|uniref:Oidioi.mRNA.OKI2018_I69.chr2.g5593.t1.cds n=1 Tax=Oikopleura dioica TaxID=34765 RepID=A0ABN7T423_OIKDI|nr:Oidioi.mRNA.OKI2018_I69.chr2.g5593.t1.cds [Oikopleura dioica]